MHSIWTVLLVSTLMLTIPSSSLPDEEGGDLDESKMTRKELGNHGWAILHTMAAYFPSDPSPLQLDHAYRFLEYFGEMFPCRTCGSHFLAMLKEYPTEFQTREEFMIYVCELHNRVNERLGYPEFECSLEHLRERWGGAGECLCGDSFLSKDTQAS